MMIIIKKNIHVCQILIETAVKRIINRKEKKKTSLLSRQHLHHLL